jgi:hypothetical protein
MPCIGCGRGFHEECATDCDTCHPVIELPEFVKSATGGAYYKDDDKVTDVHSTGRKRAALLFPLDKDAPCEWRGKKNCGGGLPIHGCINGFQQDRHHGPDKTTLNNSVGNVHRICKKCHKRWHFTNDDVYDKESYVKTAHEPEDATYDELRSYELKWIATKRGHVTVERED